jgi:type III secretion protein R
MFNFPDPAVYIPLIFALGVMPVAMVMGTSFAKIVVVLSLLKNALGLQQVPPAIVTNGLALLLTWYVMYPVGTDVWAAIEVHQQQPKSAQTLTMLEIANRAKEPLRAFLDKYASPREREFFMDAAHRLMNERIASEISRQDFVVLVPAFAVSQLTEAFLIGVLIMLPFIIVDMVVANLLMALGMQMMSPAMVSLPIKLLLFVVIDGWSRLSHALVLGYQ